jgi:acetylornithine deacetylase/succinyl-diaminopimelate desuccinylase-like protein
MDTYGPRRARRRAEVPASGGGEGAGGAAAGVDLAAAVPAIRAHRRRFVQELQDFVRFPSVSAAPRHAGDVRRCAGWLAAHLRGIGMPAVEVVETARHPIVFAAAPRLPGRPTLLIYGHYDVQPADPLGEWLTPPFAPAVRGPYLYGRGACDDKGQLFTHVKALEILLAAWRAGPRRQPARLPLPPINVKCLFEGEEEIGSPHLEAFLQRRRRDLAADAAVMSDTRMLGRGRPALTYALRGGLGFELTVSGPPHDLHSGNFGGAVVNPLQALCAIVAGLEDRDGRVAVPGFYRSVRRWDEAERRRMAASGPSDAAIRADAGVAGIAGIAGRRATAGGEGGGEPGYSLYESLTLRPALTLNGLSGGYQGPGGKGVIPARAAAKLSFRLVPDQQPAEIEALVRRHVARLAPPGVQVRLARHLQARPALLDRRHPVMQAAAAAYRRGFGTAPVLLRSGGTIPVVSLLQEILGIPTALMGFALPDDHIHAPNERLYLPNFFRGIATSLAFMDELAKPAFSSCRRWGDGCRGRRGGACRGAD